MTRGRQRRKLRQQAQALAQKEAAAAVQQAGQGPLGLLVDPHRMAGYIRMVQQAVSHDWPVTPDRKEVIVGRMLKIVKRSGNKDSSDKENDQGIRAAGVLVRADTANITRNRPTSNPVLPPPVNVNVGVSTPGPVLFYLPDNGRDPSASASQPVSPEHHSE